MMFELFALVAGLAVIGIVVGVVGLLRRGVAEARKPMHRPNLVRCDDCGTKVSRRAESCPQCGCPVSHD
jgi:rRNA maturation endonuclease Nob1